jgi:glycosyltransferase involved in cell wall biosynthesis
VTVLNDLGKPTVTVVTPTLNAARFFPDCLRSLRSQGSVVVEHLVVDDGSTDGTIELATAAGATVIDGERLGLYAAMNLGLSRATGEYVGVLNGDDYLFDGALSTLIQAMRTEGKAWSIGGLAWVDGSGKAIGTIAAPPSWMPVAVLASLGWNWMHHQTTYMTREFWASLGGFDTSLRSSADYDLLLRARRAAPCARVRVTTGAFRRHGANISMTLGGAAEEDALIATRWGPANARATTTMGYAARIYVNARNPRWWWAKRGGPDS